MKSVILLLDNLNWDGGSKVVNLSEKKERKKVAFAPVPFFLFFY
jgi:hypothetical protein